MALPQETHILPPEIGDKCLPARFMRRTGRRPRGLAQSVGESQREIMRRLREKTSRLGGGLLIDALPEGPAMRRPISRGASRLRTPLKRELWGTPPTWGTAKGRIMSWGRPGGESAPGEPARAGGAARRQTSESASARNLTRGGIHRAARDPEGDMKKLRWR